MNKKMIWVVVGIVVIAGVGYGAYWLGGKNTLSSFVDLFDSNINKSAARSQQGGGCRWSGSHEVCWSADGLRITTIDGSPL